MTRERKTGRGEGEPPLLNLFQSVSPGQSMSISREDRGHEEGHQNKEALSPSLEKQDEVEIPLVAFNRRYLLVPKILYFTLYFAYYCVYVFKLKFFKDVLRIKEGIPPKLIFKDDGALISALVFLVTAVASVFWNYISDRYLRPKMLVLLSAFLTAAFFQMFLLVNRVPEGGGRSAFSIFVIVMWTWCYSSLQPLMDAVVVEQLEKQGYGKELYGRQRMWGTVGMTRVQHIHALF